MLSGVPANQISSALLISKHGHISQKMRQKFYKNNKIVCVESDHPIPKKASMDAGNALIEYLTKLPEKEPVLFLISGGTSALVEVLQDDWDLEKLQLLTDYLLANAYSIDEINAVRRRLSKIKGGGLWAYLDNRPVACLMISDVPDDDPAIIGSGLLFPAKDKKKNKLPTLPREWREKLGDYKPIKVPDNFNGKIIACLDDAKKAAEIKAKALGYQVEIMPEFLQGDAVKTAKMCVDTVKKNKGKLCIWGGETTVQLPNNAGKSGRNQHLALAAAIEMDGMENMHLLSAGTDGSDGMTTATGAVVESLTLQIGEQQNLNAVDYLKKADSNSFFKEVGGLITTGATGTNVMDLVIAISQ
jgi:hydroxypyruvate reductase